MKCTIIQPELRSVYETQFDEDHDNINVLLDAPDVNGSAINKASDILYYDGNGDHLKPTEAFVLGSEPEPYFGKVLILGPADGKGRTTDTTLSLNDVMEMVKWL